MNLCDRCRAELEQPSEIMPQPWFDDDQKSIAGRYCQGKLWRLLKILWRRRGRYLSRDTLMTLLYENETDDPPGDLIIDVMVCKLRHRLEPTPYAISSRYGSGWQLVDRDRGDNYAG